MAETQPAIIPFREKFRVWAILVSLGALIAGIYGILHDLVTYSIGPEYFTQFKFYQFHWANLGWPDRAFAAEIGFLATFWVGAFSAHFLARTTLRHWPPPVAFKLCLKGFGTVFALGFLGALTGAYLGAHHSGDYSYWQEICEELGVVDLPAFVRVALIHNAGYLGALLGLVSSLAFLFWQKRFKGVKG